MAEPGYVSFWVALVSAAIALVNQVRLKPSYLPLHQHIFCATTVFVVVGTLTHCLLYLKMDQIMWPALIGAGFGMAFCFAHVISKRFSCERPERIRTYAGVIGFFSFCTLAATLLFP
jgi:hypothetical protein